MFTTICKPLFSLSHYCVIADLPNMALAPQITLRCNPSAVQCNPTHTEHVAKHFTGSFQNIHRTLSANQVSHVSTNFSAFLHHYIFFFFKYFHLFTIWSSLSYPKMQFSLCRTHLKLILLSSIILCSFGK